MSNVNSNKDQLFSHLYYKALINTSMTAIFFSISDGTILEANRSATEMFGYTEDEFREIGRDRIFDLADPNFQQAISERKTKGKIITELIGIKKNGERFPVEVSSSVFIDETGKEYTCTIMIDISDRKRNERDINLMINNTDEAFILVDKELKILSFNHKFQEMYRRYFGADVRKESLILDYAQADRKEVVREIYQRVLEGDTQHSEIAVPSPDLTTKIFAISYKPAKNETQAIVGVFVTIRDITEEREWNQKLTELNKQLQQRSQFIESILEYLPIGVAVNRIDTGKATLLNKQFSSIYGWPEKALSDVDTFFKCVYPDEKYRAEMIERISADIASRDVNRMQWNGISITTQTGDQRIIKAKNIPLYDQNLMISTVLDITTESLQAAEIKKAKANQEALINGTKDLIWSVDTEYKIITANNAYRGIIQSAAAHSVKEGDSVFSGFFDDTLISKWKIYYERAMQGESFSVKEELLIPSTNEVIYNHISLHPMLNDDGRIFGVACYSKDITEETLKTKMLEETRNSLRKIMDSSMDVICAVKADGTFIEVSQASEAVWGYRPEELLGKKFTDIIYPEDLPETEDIISLIMTGNDMLFIRNRYVHKNGNIVYMEWSARWDAETQVRYAVGRDITKKLEAEQDLMESERRYRELFDNNPFPMLVMDAFSSDLLDCNEAAIGKYGFSKEELLGMTLTDIRIEKDTAGAETVMRKANQYGEVAAHIWPYKMKGGEICMMETREHPIQYMGRTASLIIQHDVTEKLEAEFKLRQSEAFLAEAQRLTKMGSWNFDFRNDTLTWSDELYNVFETDKETFEQTHKSFLSMVDVKDRDLVEATSKKTQLTGEPFNIEYRITTPSGKKKIIEEYGYGEKDEQGNIVRLFGTAQDVTEWKKAQDKISETSMRYEYVTKATFDAVWDWDIASDKVFWGENYYRIFGYADDENLSDTQNVLKRIHPDEINDLTESAKKVWHSRETTWEYEHRFLKSDGTYSFVSNNALIIRDETGTPKRIIGAMKDITQQKQEEQRLKLLESVVTNTQDAVLITEAEPFDDPGPRIVYVNDAFTKMTGYTKEEVIGKTPRILQGPKSDWNELARLSKALRNWEPCEITTINYKKTGEEFWNNFSITPVANEAGWFTHWIATERDITARKIEELQREFLTEVGLLFNEEEPLNQILKKVLKMAAQYLDFSAAEAWLLSENTNTVNQVATYADSEKAELFFTESADIHTLLKGQGLTGASWETSKILFLNEVDKYENFIRREAAVKAGLRAACGIPLTRNNKIIGGIMLWSNEKQFDEQKFNLFFQRFSSHISVEIRRKQLEQDLNRVFNFAPDIIGIIGFDGFFKKLNPVLPDLLECTDEELRSRHFIDFVHPDDKELFVSELNKISHGGSALFFEVRCLTRSGQYIWISWTATPMPEEQLIFTVGKNVTEKKELEALLQRASGLAKIGAWELDLVKQSLSWSDITREIHEVPQDYIPDLEKDILFYKEGESRNSIKQAIRAALEKGINWDLELQIITAKGNEKWIRSIGETEWIDGKCIRIYGSFQDIDSLRKAEDNIRLSNERYILAFKATSDIIFDWNLVNNETIRSAENIENLLGYKPEVSQADNFVWMNYVHPDDIERVKEKLNRVLQDPQMFFYEDEYRFLRANHTYAYLYDRGYIIRNEQGVVTRVIGSVKDISKLKENEIQLQKRADELAVSNLELEQFAFVASHDLQEPLRMVTSFLTKLEKNYDAVLDEKARKYIHFAVDGAKRMRQIILDLLEYSRVGRLDSLPEDINVLDIIQEVEILLKKKITEKDARISIDPMPVIHFSRSPLRQVFQNLISNALKYTREDATVKIHIGVSEHPAYWQFSVSDNGIGIHPDYFQKVFVLFQRLHTKSEYSGTGIGLTVSKKIIENQGGKIWVESKEGKGSTFFFTIPKK